MLRLLPLWFVLVAMQVSPGSAQDNARDPRASLPPTDPVYAEAMKLSRTLTRHEIQVRCVLLSKEAQMFEGQLGAAFFRTDIGDFDAQFLPSSQSWDKLKVIEQREPGGYTKYRFQGSPTYSGTWEGKSVYFVKHRNQFLHSLDQRVVTKLREALQRE
jgi:hypothetical protein